MGRPPFPHGGGRPPPPQGFLPQHFQGHPQRHQSLIEANNSGAQPPQPHQGHHARSSNFNQQPIHKVWIFKWKFHKAIFQWIIFKLQQHPTHLYTQQQRAAVAEQYNKLHGYGGQVLPAARQPQSFTAAPITRQANAGWMPPPEFQRSQQGPVSNSRPNSVSNLNHNASPAPNSGYERPRSASEQQAAAAAAAVAAGAGNPNKVVVMDIFCKNCRQEANFMCSACKSVHYCSLECQVCKILKFSSGAFRKSLQAYKRSARRSEILTNFSSFFFRKIIGFTIQNFAIQKLQHFNKENKYSEFYL